MSVQGLQAFNRRMARLPRSAKVELERAVTESAERVRVLAQALAPVDSGRLAASLRVEQGRHALAKNIVAGGSLTEREIRKGSGEPYDYSLGQEFGTSEMDANAFLHPALRVLRKSIKARINRAVRKSIKEGSNA